MSWPRIQFFEIGDQPWCPAWLHKHEMTTLTRLWNLHVPGWSRGTLATQACEVFKQYLPDLASYTVIDACAGAGGPTPFMERELNKALEAKGEDPVQFILTDIAPKLEEWEVIAKKQSNISFIREPVDARAVRRFTDSGSKRKECRIYNISFHHFDDEAARGILQSAVQSADSFVIFEVTTRQVSTCLCALLNVPFSFYVTLLSFWASPVILFFTFLVPLTPLAALIDGVISCLRTRTPREIHQLLDQPDLDLSKWKITSGERIVQWPVITLYYHIGVKVE